jgi:DNA replication protein DnaC
MTTPDEPLDKGASEIWRAERRQRLLANLLAGRPATFSRPGILDSRLKTWAGLLAGGKGRSLILTGPVGTGKTWAIWHAAEEAVRAGYEGRVVVTTAARFRRIVAPATADPREFERYCAAGLLVLDDIGAVRLSEWDMDHLGELADERWGAQSPTVLSSNETKLRELLGPRISSRLADNALVIEMDNPDRRRQP